MNEFALHRRVMRLEMMDFLLLDLDSRLGVNEFGLEAFQCHGYIVVGQQVQILAGTVNGWRGAMMDRRVRVMASTCADDKILLVGRDVVVRIPWTRTERDENWEGRKFEVTYSVWV